MTRPARRRVLVIGPGGAGKTTLARALADRTGLPLHHLDALFWRPGWVPAEASAWEAEVTRLAAGDAWVMDGNYGGTLDLRLARADLVVFLDVSRWRCLARVLRRRVRYGGRSRPSLPEGCPERLTLEFLAWIWSYPRRRRPGILGRLAGLPAHVDVRILRTPRDVRCFLDEWEGVVA